MPSPGLSPSFRHTRCRSGQSPMEIKERMRKSYKERIISSRHALFNNLRGSRDEAGMRDYLALMLRDMFPTEYSVPLEDEEYQVLEIIKEELVQAEMNWLLEEYEKANFEHIDWAAVDSTDDIICPICQKLNLMKQNDTVKCPKCNWTVHTNKTMSQLKSDITDAVEIHSRKCTSVAQFIKFTDLKEEHIFLICEDCLDMKLVL